MQPLEFLVFAIQNNSSLSVYDFPDNRVCMAKAALEAQFNKKFEYKEVLQLLLEEFPEEMKIKKPS